MMKVASLLWPIYSAGLIRP